MEAGSFLVKWNNFNNVLGFHLSKCRDESKYCDCTLSVGGKFIQAHRVVLSASSKYFDDIFSVTTERQLIVLHDMDHEDVELIVQFAYSGETTVKAENLARFMKTAKHLQMKGMIDGNHNKKPYETPPTPPSAHQSPEKISETPEIAEIKSEFQSSPAPAASPLKTVSTTPVAETNSAKKSGRKRKAEASSPLDTKSKKRLGRPPTEKVNCGHCQNKYTRSSLGGHEKDCKMNPERTVHECPECQKQLSRADKLKRHMQNVHTVSSRNSL